MTILEAAKVMVSLDFCRVQIRLVPIYLYKGEILEISLDESKDQITTRIGSA